MAVQVQLLPDALKNGNGPFVYRFRTPASHAGKAGSIPARVTRNSDQVVESADTRRSERRALGAWEFKSPLGHLKNDAGAAGAQLALIRPVTSVRFRGLQFGIAADIDAGGPVLGEGS